MKLLKLFAIAFATYALMLSSCCAQNRVSFGESCNKTVRCDSKAFLTCVNETCQCLKQTEMMFDSTRSKCVVLAGERCQYTTIEADGEGRSWTEALNCVENSSCNSEGFCDCQIEFYENLEGRCAPRKNYSESCEKIEECNKIERLICNGGKCSCNETEAIYDEHHGDCALRTGIPGVGYKRCVMNARCNFFSFFNVCVGECRCLDGFKNSTNGLCLGDYNQPCDPKLSPCENHLSCNGGKCGCPFPQKQDYNTTLKKCLSHLNGPCQEKVRGEVTQYECRGEAECRDDNGVYECLCKKGYIKSKENICKKAHGNNCTTHEKCDVVPWAHLRCIEGVCSCGDYQVYDQISTRCLGLVGADCSEKVKCVRHAQCKRQRPYPFSSNGICRCKAGTKIDADRKCSGGGATSPRPGATLVTVLEPEPKEYSVEV